jgi:tetratricopeptide (TPR) repeat protein
MTTSLTFLGALKKHVAFKCLLTIRGSEDIYMSGITQWSQSLLAQQVMNGEFQELVSRLQRPPLVVRLIVTHSICKHLWLHSSATSGVNSGIDEHMNDFVSHFLPAFVDAYGHGHPHLQSARHICMIASLVVQASTDIATVQKWIALWRGLGDINIDLKRLCFYLDWSCRVKERKYQVKRGVSGIYDLQLCVSTTTLHTDSAGRAQLVPQMGEAERLSPPIPMFLTEGESNADTVLLLNILAFRFYDVGQPVESLATLRAAVSARRRLNREQLAFNDAVYATWFHVLHCRLRDIGRHTDALIAIQKSTKIFGTLAARHPKKYSTNFVKSLDSLHTHLFDLGRGIEAAAVVQQAVQAFQGITVDEPETLSPHMIRLMTLYGNGLTRLERQSEALSAFQEAVSLRQHTALPSPSWADAKLAKSLYALSESLSTRGKYEESLVAISQAVLLYQGFASEQPAYNCSMAKSLRRLSHCLTDTGRHGASLIAQQEALILFAAPAMEQPITYRHFLQKSTRFRSVYLAESGGIGHLDECAAILGLQDVYKEVSLAEPAMLNHYMAGALSSLSGSLSDRLFDLGQPEQGFVAILQVAQVQRAYGKPISALCNGYLIKALLRLSYSLSDFSDPREDLVHVQSIVTIYRKLTPFQSAKHNVTLVSWLHKLSAILLALGESDEAMTIIREAENTR